jgi:hypothetical protein
LDTFTQSASKLLNLGIPGRCRNGETIDTIPGYVEEEAAYKDVSLKLNIVNIVGSCSTFEKALKMGQTVSSIGNDAADHCYRMNQKFADTSSYGSALDSLQELSAEKLQFSNAARADLGFN